MKNWALLILALLVIAIEPSIAQNIQKPDFINNSGTDAVRQGGSEIFKWIVIIFGTVVGLVSIIPAFHFIGGRSQEGWEWVKNIVIGVFVAVILGGLVFAVISAMGG